MPSGYRHTCKGWYYDLSPLRDGPWECQLERHEVKWIHRRTRRHYTTEEALRQQAKDDSRRK